LAGYAIQCYDAELLALLRPSPTMLQYLCQSLDCDISKVSALPPRAGCDQNDRGISWKVSSSVMHFSTVNYYVMVISNSIDSDGPKGKRFKPHMRLRRHDVRRSRGQRRTRFYSLRHADCTSR
jgi:hypothetical protein